MKITPDVNYVGMRPAGNVSSRMPVSTHVNNTAAINNKLASDISSRLQQDRATIDALTIAQTSMVIIQKAIDISARLKAIAFQAMTTGNVNVRELGNELAEIQGTMQTYGEVVTVPVNGSTFSKQNTLNSDIPAEMTKMVSAAETMSSGTMVDPEVFSGIGNTLTGIALRAGKNISDMASQLGAVNYKAVSSTGSIPVSDMPSQIVEDAGEAIIAQGNISPDVVRALTTA